MSSQNDTDFVLQLPESVAESIPGPITEEGPKVRPNNHTSLDFMHDLLLSSHSFLGSITCPMSRLHLAAIWKGLASQASSWKACGPHVSCSVRCFILQHMRPDERLVVFK